MFYLSKVGFIFRDALASIGPGFSLTYSLKVNQEIMTDSGDVEGTKIQY